MVTGFYAALLGGALIYLITCVVRMRRDLKVAWGDGGNQDLMRQIRAHGNFVETVPMALILMLIAELSMAPVWFLHLMGLMLVGARISHYIGHTRDGGILKYRIGGMAGTMGVYGLCGLYCLLSSLGF